MRRPFHCPGHGSARRRPPSGPPGSRRGTPNVLYIVWDDAGIATWTAFGGLAETPTMKWLAGRGLRYSQWHTDALPSLTRLGLLTGRHGVPAARGQAVSIPREAGTLAEILGRSGYRTYCLGQWHHSPRAEALAEPCTVPAARGTWPLGRGFDRYYGVLDHQAGPWYPDLVFDDQHVDPPYAPADGYHLSRDIADMAIEFLREGCRGAPGRPWLCYLSFAASAAPQEWADRYRGRFDMGYDRCRQVVLGNMTRLGIVPGGTSLAPADWPAGSAVPAWHSLTEEQRRLSSRLAEAGAGLCSFTDHQVGRLLQHLEESGELDDTIVVVCSANAASGATGDTDYRAGWAWACRTPYHAARQDLVGGTAASPLIISWPPETASVAGGVRDQYHHAIDIVPTILDCAGIDLPLTVNGHVQGPLPGVSMRYTFTSPRVRSARQTQLYEMSGARAVYHSGWKAVAAGGPAGPHRWELYDLSADRAETRDLAARHPDKVAVLSALWRAEEQGRVLPVVPRPRAARAV